MSPNPSEPTLEELKNGKLWVMDMRLHCVRLSSPLQQITPEMVSLAKLKLGNFDPIYCSVNLPSEDEAIEPMTSNEDQWEATIRNTMGKSGSKGKILGGSLIAFDTNTSEFDWSEFVGSKLTEEDDHQYEEEIKEIQQEIENLLYETQSIIDQEGSQHQSSIITKQKLIKQTKFMMKKYLNLLSGSGLWIELYNDLDELRLICRGILSPIEIQYEMINNSIDNEDYLSKMIPGIQPFARTKLLKIPLHLKSYDECILPTGCAWISLTIYMVNEEKLLQISQIPYSLPSIIEKQSKKTCGKLDSNGIKIICKEEKCPICRDIEPIIVEIPAFPSRPKVNKLSESEISDEYHESEEESLLTTGLSDDELDILVATVNRTGNANHLLQPIIPKEPEIHSILRESHATDYTFNSSMANSAITTRSGGRRRKLRTSVNHFRTFAFPPEEVEEVTRWKI